MSNTHSKQTQMIPCQCQCEDGAECECEWPYFEEASYSDKLVLKLEETSEETGDIQLKCYVVYDHTEDEYFICGKNQSTDGLREFEDFKFYCKTRKRVTSFLKYLLSSTDASGKINHVLYNYKYLDEYDCVDYWVLEDQEDSQCELAGYDGANFSKSWLSPLLKTLKHVRY